MGDAVDVNLQAYQSSCCNFMKTGGFFFFFLTEAPKTESITLDDLVKQKKKKNFKKDV